MMRSLLELGISLAFPRGNSVGGFARAECVVLRYRGVTDAQAPRFRRQIEWLAAHTNIIPAADIPRVPASPTDARRTVAITFDAAFENLERNAIPMLRQMRIPATLFAVSANLGRKPKWVLTRFHSEAEEMLMAEGPLAALPRDLFEIGSHTATHRNLTRLSRGEIRAELANSKNDLQLSLGRPITALSVPYGQWNREILEVAQEIGYSQVFTCDPIAASIGSNNLAIGRFEVTPDDWMPEFMLKATGSLRSFARRRDLPKINSPPKPRGPRSAHQRQTAAV